MKENEKVLVVASNILFGKGHWQGLKTDNLAYYLDLIKKNFKFKFREEVENNSSWRQVIPYIIFNFEDKYFLYRYLENANEIRLRKDLHLGVAGHINPIDIKPGNDILEMATMREWREEVEYEGNLVKKKLIGILNDERRPVESVHLGVIYHFIGDSPDISVKEKGTLEGELIRLGNLGRYLKNIGGWAPLVYQEYLSKFL